MLNEKMGAITPSKFDTSLGIEIAYVCVAQGGACGLEPVNADTQEAAAYLLDARDNLVEREHLLYLSSEAQKLGSAVGGGGVGGGGVGGGGVGGGVGGGGGGTNSEFGVA